MKQTALGALHAARGAQMREYQGWEIPAVYSSLRQEYEALQEGVGLIDLSWRVRLLISGRDRRSWLHGQVTQEINGLEEGRGAYAAILTPQGRMVADMRVYALPDALLAEVPSGNDPPVAEYLERFLIMERAEIEDVTESWAQLSLQGPLSPCALTPVLGAELADLTPWAISPAQFQGTQIYVARVAHCGEDGFDLFVPSDRAAALWAALCEHRAAFAVHSVGWEALNVRRVEAGIPWWGEELDGSQVPLEARLDHAISLHKGCYVGQEIIARIDARGHVNNLLAGFHVAGDRLPERGAEIHHGGKRVGKVMTALNSLRLDRPVALGYLRRELQEPGAQVEAVTDAGPIALTVSALPFVPHDLTPQECPPTE